MPITYTWTINALVGYPTFDGETDVVTRASYTVTGDDGEGHTADYSNWQETPLDPSAPFIPYNDLTPEVVTGWVQAGLGPEKIASIEESIAIDIQRQVTPEPEPQSFPLPWVPPAPPAPPAPELPLPAEPVAPEVEVITQDSAVPAAEESSSDSLPST